MEKRLFTSESVTEGHPDKVCDAISDAILDACMAEDPMSRVACETASCTGFVLVTGEITTKAQLDVPAIVRKTVNESAMIAEAQRQANEIVSNAEKQAAQVRAAVNKYCTEKLNATEACAVQSLEEIRKCRAQFEQVSPK